MHGYWLFAVATFIGSLELIVLTVEWHARRAQGRRLSMAPLRPTIY